MLRRLVLATAIACCCGAVAAPVFAQDSAPAASSSQTPEQVVINITQELDKAIAGHKAELKNDNEKLIKLIDKILLPHFDTDYASILVLGQHARQATPAQRERFSKAFYTSLTHRYAEGLLNYTKGAVKVLPFAGDLNTQRSIVRTRVVLDDGKQLSVDYAFRKTQDGQWKAYDVIIEGISYITNYRSQVDAEIRKVGIDKLITNLETKGQEALKTMSKDSKGGGE